MSPKGKIPPPVKSGSVHKMPTAPVVARGQSRAKALSVAETKEITEKFAKAVKEGKYTDAIEYHKLGADPNALIDKNTIYDLLGLRAIKAEGVQGIVLRQQIINLMRELRYSKPDSQRPVVRKVLKVESKKVSDTLTIQHHLAQHGDIILMEAFFPTTSYDLKAHSVFDCVWKEEKKDSKKDKIDNDHYGEAPVHYAVRNYQFNMLKYLVDKRRSYQDKPDNSFSVNLRREKKGGSDLGGFTPLDEATIALQKAVKNNNEEQATIATHMLIYLAGKAALSNRQDTNQFISRTLRQEAIKIREKSWGTKDKLAKAIGDIEATVIAQSEQRKSSSSNNAEKKAAAKLARERMQDIVKLAEEMNVSEKLEISDQDKAFLNFAEYKAQRNGATAQQEGEPAQQDQSSVATEGLAPVAVEQDEEGRGNLEEETEEQILTQPQDLLPLSPQRSRPTSASVSEAQQSVEPDVDVNQVGDIATIPEAADQLDQGATLQGQPSAQDDGGTPATTTVPANEDTVSAQPTSTDEEVGAVDATLDTNNVAATGTADTTDSKDSNDEEKISATEDANATALDTAVPTPPSKPASAKPVVPAPNIPAWELPFKLGGGANYIDAGGQRFYYIVVEGGNKLFTIPSIARYYRGNLLTSSTLEASSVSSLFGDLIPEDRMKLIREISIERNNGGEKSRDLPPILHKAIELGEKNAGFRKGLLEHEAGFSSNEIKPGLMERLSGTTQEAGLLSAEEFEELIDVRDAEGRSALDVAVEKGNYAMADWLIRHGAEIEKGDKERAEEFQRWKEEDPVAAEQAEALSALQFAEDAEEDAEIEALEQQAAEEVAAEADSRSRATTNHRRGEAQQATIPIANRVINRMIADRKSALQLQKTKQPKKGTLDASSREAQEKANLLRENDRYDLLSTLADIEEINDASDEQGILEIAAEYASGDAKVKNSEDPQFLSKLLDVDGIKKVGLTHVQATLQMLQDKFPQADSGKRRSFGLWARKPDLALQEAWGGVKRKLEALEKELQSEKVPQDQAQDLAAAQATNNTSLAVPAPAGQEKDPDIEASDVGQSGVALQDVPHQSPQQQTQQDPTTRADFYAAVKTGEFAKAEGIFKQGNVQIQDPDADASEKPAVLQILDAEIDLRKAAANKKTGGVLGLGTKLAGYASIPPQELRDMVDLLKAVTANDAPNAVAINDSFDPKSRSGDNGEERTLLTSAVKHAVETGDYDLANAVLDLPGIEKVGAVQIFRAHQDSRVGVATISAKYPIELKNLRRRLREKLIDLAREKNDPNELVDACATSYVLAVQDGESPVLVLENLLQRLNPEYHGRLVDNIQDSRKSFLMHNALEYKGTDSDKEAQKMAQLLRDISTKVAQDQAGQETYYKQKVNAAKSIFSSDSVRTRIGVFEAAIEKGDYKQTQELFGLSVKPQDDPGRIPAIHRMLAVREKQRKERLAARAVAENPNESGVALRQLIEAMNPVNGEASLDLTAKYQGQSVLRSAAEHAVAMKDKDPNILLEFLNIPGIEKVGVEDLVEIQRYLVENIITSKHKKYEDSWREVFRKLATLIKPFFKESDPQSVVDTPTQTGAADVPVVATAAVVAPVTSTASASAAAAVPSSVTVPVPDLSSTLPIPAPLSPLPSQVPAPPSRASSVVSEEEITIQEYLDADDADFEEKARVLEELLNAAKDNGESPSDVFAKIAAKNQGKTPLLDAIILGNQGLFNKSTEAIDEELGLENNNAASMLDARGEDGFTALEEAVSKGYISAVELLFNFGANTKNEVLPLAHHIVASMLNKPESLENYAALLNGVTISREPDAENPANAVELLAANADGKTILDVLVKHATENQDPTFLLGTLPFIIKKIGAKEITAIQDGLKDVERSGTHKDKWQELDGYLATEAMRANARVVAAALEDDDAPRLAADAERRMKAAADARKSSKKSKEVPKATDELGVTKSGGFFSRRRGARKADESAVEPLIDGVVEEVATIDPLMAAASGFYKKVTVALPLSMTPDKEAQRIGILKGILERASKQNLSDPDNPLTDAGEIAANAARIINAARNPRTNVPLVCEMAQQGLADTVRFLLTNGAAVNTEYTLGQRSSTLLHDAVTSRDPKTVEVVLGFEPTLNRTIGDKDTTPFHIAAREYAAAVQYPDEERKQKATAILGKLHNAGHDEDIAEKPTKTIFSTTAGQSARGIIEAANRKAQDRLSKEFDLELKALRAARAKEEETQRKAKEKLEKDAKKTADKATKEKKKNGGKVAAAVPAPIVTPAGVVSPGSEMTPASPYAPTSPMLGSITPPVGSDPFVPPSGAPSTPLSPLVREPVLSPAATDLPGMATPGAEPHPHVTYIPTEDSEHYGEGESDEREMSYDDVLRERTDAFNRVVNANIIGSPERVTTGRELFAAFISGFEKIYRCATKENDRGNHVYNDRDAYGVWMGISAYTNQKMIEPDRFLNPIEKLAIITFVKPGEGFRQVCDGLKSIDPKASFDDKIEEANNRINYIVGNDCYAIMQSLLTEEHVDMVADWAHDRVEGRGGFREKAERDYSIKQQIAREEMLSSGRPSTSPQRPAWQRSYEALERAHDRELSMREGH